MLAAIETLGAGASASPTAISARIILFGSILAWAVIDRISLKRRTDPGAPPIPVGGMAQRRDRDLRRRRCSMSRSVWWFHPYVIGVPVFGS